MEVSKKNHLALECSTLLPKGYKNDTIFGAYFFSIQISLCTLLCSFLCERWFTRCLPGTTRPGACRRARRERANADASERRKRLENVRSARQNLAWHPIHYTCMYMYTIHVCALTQNIHNHPNHSPTSEYTSASTAITHVLTSAFAEKSERNFLKLRTHCRPQ